MTMPPFELWVRGRDDITTWMVQPGAMACAGSILIPVTANGVRAWGQYKPAGQGDGYTPWALQVNEVIDGKLSRLTFFLDAKRLFPLFGLPVDAVPPPQRALPAAPAGQLPVMCRSSPSHLGHG